MLVNVYCAKCVGIEAVKVTVEVDIRQGVGIHLVGLADMAVRESLLRTVTALQALGFRIPGMKIVINLAPADLHKSGSGYDLAIALGIIAASGQCALPLLGEYLVMGELGLDGSVREIPGALVIAQAAVEMGFKGCILPRRSALEATCLDSTEIYGVNTLMDVTRVMSGQRSEDLLVWNTPEFEEYARERDSGKREDMVDFRDIVGQQGAKRAIEIACGGGHNLIMIGPPGAGKSSLAKAIPGILPPMTYEEALLTSKLYSVAGMGGGRARLADSRPVRSPHYSASLAAIIGGGNSDNIVPGEVSLAHGGVLFLDEVIQMPRSVLEALRAPIEDRKVCISRLRVKVEYPCSFMLVAASNPCPCGYWGEGDKCTCTPSQRLSYLSRLSGPIMDRIDLQVWMRPVESRQMLSSAKAEASAAVRERVCAAREIQRRRFEGESIHSNAEMTNKHVERFCPLSEECRQTLEQVMENTGMSMRAFFRIIKVARTVADLAGCTDIAPEHLLEAAGYRFLDKRNI